MRAIPVLALLAACGSSGGSTTFDDSGGTLAVASCGYSVTTKLGAEAPKVSGSTFGKDPTPEFVHLGFVGDPRTSMVAQWRTVDETTTAGFVRYAAGDNLTADQLTEKATGIEFGYKGSGTTIYRSHQAHMCDLQPNTTYSYQVGSTNGGKQYLSPVYTFHTAPDLTATPDNEALIGVIGDSRDSAQIWGQIAGELKTRSADMLLFTGDAVLLNTVQSSWDDWFSAAPDVLASTPIVFVDGNHEGNAINFYGEFAMPGDQENFGFDWGYAHFTVANDTPESSDAELMTTTRDAIQADFAASANARWKVLTHHQPMYGSDPRHTSDLTLRAAWAPLVDQYGIDLVLNGHDHQYEITYPLNNSTVQSTSANATVYVIFGGAGADLDVSGSDFFTQYVEQTYGASVLHARRDTLTLESFRQDGSVITPGFSKTKP
jgi:predicted phosphodiesterase